MRNIEKIEALLKSIETGDTQAVSVVNEAKYIQHNPQTHEGSEGLASLFKRLSLTSPRVNMVRGFEDDNYVFAHMEYDFASRKIGFEVFRFEESQAVEHWDNIQERQGPNQNGHSMISGPTQAIEKELTAENKKSAKAFATSVLIEGQIERIAEFVNTATFIDHNPRLDGTIEGVQKHLTQSTNGSPYVDYRKLHRVLGEGNFVLCVSEGVFDDTHTAFYDLFRLEDGKICEHWDTVEKIAPKSQWKNNNGKF